MTSESAELVVLKSINNKLIELIDIFKLKDIVGTIVKKDLADFSKSDRPQSATDKPMPEMLGEYTVGKKGCNKCNGKITWDNYDKETHPYPDHINEDGELILDGCPEYNK